MVKLIYKAKVGGSEQWHIGISAEIFTSCAKSAAGRRAIWRASWTKKASTISSYETDSKTPSVDTIIAMSELFGVSIDELIYGENAEVLSTKHLAAEQKRAVADLLQGLTLYNDGNDKDGLARTRLLLQVIKARGL